MSKKIIFAFLILISLATYAQEGTASPYSFFGIGDVKFKGNIENRSMGTVSVLSDSIHLNLQNPAQYANLKLTNFSVAGTYNSTKLTTNSQSEKSQRTALNYLAIGIPFKKITVGFGLMPYSSVGYKLSNVDYTNSIGRQYRGKGGVNKAFLGFGYKINNHFNVGVEAQYNFGEIETTSIFIKNGMLNSVREVNNSHANGINFNTGLYYTTKLNSKLSLYSSATYQPSSNLTFKNTRQLATIQFSSTGSEIVVDLAETDAIPSTKIKMPSKTTFGVGIGQTKKWAAATEVTLQDNSKFTNRFADINATYTNATRVAFGGYFIPKYNSYSSFFKKVVYRAGLRFENTGLVINNQSIKDNAVTLGFGLPLRGNFSNINLGLEYGSRGTKSAGLIKENYFNLSFGFSFNDRWFQRSKFD